MDSNARTERLRQRLKNMTVERGCTPAEAAAAAKKLADLERRDMSERVQNLLNQNLLGFDELAAFLPEWVLLDGEPVELKKMNVTTLRRLLTLCASARVPGVYEQVRVAQIERELKRRNKKC